MDDGSSASSVIIFHIKLTRENLYTGKSIRFSQKRDASKFEYYHLKDLLKLEYKEHLFNKLIKIQVTFYQNIN